jgi:hypothetical protein
MGIVTSGSERRGSCIRFLATSAQKPQLCMGTDTYAAQQQVVSHSSASCLSGQLPDGSDAKTSATASASGTHGCTKQITGSRRYMSMRMIDKLLISMWI